MSRTVISTDAPTPLAWPAKDPDELLAYSIDFAERLAGDEIISAEWSLIVPAGIDIDDSEYQGTRAIARIGAGTVGLTAKLHCRIVTLAAQTMDETVSLPIASR